MRFHLCLLCLGIASADVGLAAQQSLVVPQAASTVDHQPYVDMPFTVNAGRFQHLVEGSAITASTALLREFSYRIDQRVGSASKGRVLPRLEVWVSRIARPVP